MPINVNDPEYTKAEIAFHEAKTLEEQLLFLNKMISHAPSHKGAENLRQQLTTKRKRLESQIEKKRKRGKPTKGGIRKEEMQAVIIGKTNSGKSSLLKTLTNAQPKISSVKFTTNKPQIGIMEYNNSQIQIIEIPAINGENFDKSIVHTADIIIALLKTDKDIPEMKKSLDIATGKIIYVINFSDKLLPKEKRKVSARLKSKRYNFEIISCISNWPENGIEELKKHIFESFDIIRIFTKEPGKPKTKKPIIMKPNSKTIDAAEKILKGFSKKVKTIKIWGPSSKFSGQIVGLNHKLKDLDTVEFTTK